MLLIFLEAQLCDLLRTRGHHHLHSENYPSESKVWGIKLKDFQSPQNVNNGQARDAKGHKGHPARKRSIRDFLKNVNCFLTYGCEHLQYKYQNATNVVVLLKIHKIFMVAFPKVLNSGCLCSGPIMMPKIFKITYNGQIWSKNG